MPDQSVATGDRSVREQFTQRTGIYRSRDERPSLRQETAYQAFDAQFARLSDTLEQLWAKQERLAAILRRSTEADWQLAPRGSLFDARF